MISLLVLALPGLGVGLLMGLLGGGGALLTIPVLAYLLGYEVNDAVAGGLVVVGLASAFALLAHLRAGNVDVRRGLIFALAASGAAYLSARLGAHLNGNVRMLIFAAVVLSAAVAMFRSHHEAAAAAKEGSRVVLPAAAVSVGTLTGLIGVGGGFLAVPALTAAGGLSMRRAVGTSALIIALNSVAGLAGLGSELTLAWRELLGFAAAATFGAMAGARLMPRLSVNMLRRLFAFLLIGIECVMVYQLLFKSRLQ
jgi:uncharacterized membrane protein YfcA